MSKDIDDDDLAQFAMENDKPQPSTLFAGIHKISQSETDSNSGILDPEQDEISKLKKGVRDYVARGASSNTLKKSKHQ